MDLGARCRLEAIGGPTLQRYRELTAAADMSAAGSPAALAKASFERDFADDWQAVIAAIGAESLPPAETAVAEPEAAAQTTEV
jgi:hypothetical protein